MDVWRTSESLVISLLSKVHPKARMQTVVQQPHSDSTKMVRSFSRHGCAESDYDSVSGRENENICHLK